MAERLFPSRILNMVGKETFLKSARSVEWQQKWLGSTDYIDSTRPDDFTDTNSIYYGVDCYQRPFIFLKVKCFKYSKNTTDLDRKEKYIMVNIFQRYTDNDSLYVACCRNYDEGNALLEGMCAINDELSSNISNFLKNGYVEREADEYRDKVRLEISL